MNDSTTSHYSVSGMKCEGCVSSATEALSKLPGFVSAKFDLSNRSAVVTGDLDSQLVAKTLSDAGYPAEVQER